MGYNVFWYLYATGLFTKFIKTSLFLNQEVFIPLRSPLTYPCFWGVALPYF